MSATKTVWDPREAGTAIDPRGVDEVDLLEAFESLSLAPGSFGHEMHVRIAFAYLRRHDLFEALRRSREGLRRFAEHAGAPEKYHETVTCALVLLIHERMAGSCEGDAWEAFAAANPDLLAWKGGAFFDYYPPDVLDSALARRTFVLPHAAGAGRTPRGVDS